MNSVLVLFMLGAYLIGSIPFAVIISKYKFGKDIRNLGSGNAGATNMARNFGRKAGISTLILDLLKGAIPPLIYISYLNLQTTTIPNSQFHAFLIAYATGLGHIYPVFANFKGGKGVATLLGSMLILQTPLALIGLLAFVGILLFSNYVSLSSILSALLFAFLFNWKESFHISSFVAWGFPALFIFTHRSNIQRLIKGNENKTLLLKKK
jgi:acyl phosphate:glycerol-3-phosphate acyltransferase